MKPSYQVKILCKGTKRGLKEKHEQKTKLKVEQEWEEEMNGGKVNKMIKSI